MRPELGPELAHGSRKLEYGPASRSHGSPPALPRLDIALDGWTWRYGVVVMGLMKHRGSKLRRRTILELNATAPSQACCWNPLPCQQLMALERAGDVVVGVVEDEGEVEVKWKSELASVPRNMTTS